ncbi:NOP58 family protein [Candidatus Woesearchaeota archaeon]|nr:NOP58 family protein [Candidatus Woesearchaeota archaeon]
MGFEKYYNQNLEETKKKLREAVKFDDFIVQAINNIDEINRIANTLVKRLREWYEFYNPEFSRSIFDHEKFVEAIISGEVKKETDSMGAELSKEDMAAVLNLAEEIDSLYKLKEKQEEYLEKLMQKNCPNIAAVAGYLIGARLIAIAGDLKRLVRFPASTVQLLGAEKALFRHMKTGARAPKYGVIHEHPLVTGVGMKDKGKVARGLADKISIASKIDYFKGEFIGDELRKKLEERFKCLK